MIYLFLFKEAGHADDMRVMYVFETIAPILILLMLGAILARIRFLGPQFMTDLNKLTFWIALPVMIFQSVAKAATPDSEAGRIFLALMIVTLLATGIAWFGAKLLRLPPTGTGALMQVSYRGNLVYIGVPVLLYSFVNLHGEVREQALATALLVMAPTTAVFNVLAVIVLQGPQHQLSGKSFRLVGWSILTNPLIIACVAGYIFTRFSIPLPVFLDRTLKTLGDVAVPVALLCIGGSLVLTTLHGRKSAIILGALIKTGGCLALAWLLGKFFGFHGEDFRILLVLAACPTAAASYIMAKEMRSDEVLTSGGVALSTIFSVLTLIIALSLA